MKSNQTLVIAIACVVTTALRVVDLQSYNFGSMLALSLLCGFAIRSRFACLVPLLVRLLTDVVLQVRTGYGFWDTWYFDYTAYVLITLLGQQILRWQILKKASGFVAGGALALLGSAAAVWFLKTDLSVEQLSLVRGIVACCLVCIVGYLVLRSISNDVLLKVFSATAASIAIYFFVSNFGAWLLYSPTSYERSISGLLNCYYMGLPFVRTTVIGNLIFAPLFFAAWNLVTSPATSAKLATDE